MTINVDEVKNWAFPVIRQAFTEKDTILYALALGYGVQPTSDVELRFVYERGLMAVPTMATTLCYPGFWIADPRTGINADMVVYGEQRMIFHSPMAASGMVRGQTRVVDVIDKGKDKGAIVISERTLHDDLSGVLLASIEQLLICRGDGGFATTSIANPKSVQSSMITQLQRKPDHCVDIQTIPQAALIYRLSADMNPLHVDPALARSAGFDRPILHGLCSYGIAARAIIQACCGNDPRELAKLSVRFSSPVFPGETIRTEIWSESGQLHFRCIVPERGVVIITNGIAETRNAKDENDR